MPEIRVPFVSDCIRQSSDRDHQTHNLNAFALGVFNSLWKYEGHNREEPRLLVTSIWLNAQGDMVYCTAWARLNTYRSMTLLRADEGKTYFQIIARKISENCVSTIPMSLSSFGKNLHFITFCNVEGDDLEDFPCESFKYIDLNRVKELCREPTLERSENTLPPQCFIVPGDT